MANKVRKKVLLILTLCMVLIFGSSINAYAYVDESAGTEATTEAVAVEEELTVEAEKDKEETAEETTEGEGSENTGAFSESGNLSLLDDVGTDASKELEYMTVQTKSGAVFYLVIDRSTDTENVYFLNQVDAADLMAIMDDSEKQEYEASLETETEVQEMPKEEETETETETETPEKEPTIQTNNLELFGVIGVVAVLVIGGYVFMKKKAKKDGSDLEEDLEFYDDEEYENEDEQEIEFVDLEEEE